MGDSFLFECYHLKTAYRSTYHRPSLPLLHRVGTLRFLVASQQSVAIGPKRTELELPPARPGRE